MGLRDVFEDFVDELSLFHKWDDFILENGPRRFLANSRNKIFPTKLKIIIYHE
jgi:hypothetical protein